jgi:hypothetical protein
MAWHTYPLFSDLEHLSGITAHEALCSELRAAPLVHTLCEQSSKALLIEVPIWWTLLRKTQAFPSAKFELTAA